MNRSVRLAEKLVIVTISIGLAACTNFGANGNDTGVIDVLPEVVEDILIVHDEGIIVPDTVVDVGLDARPDPGSDADSEVSPTDIKTDDNQPVDANDAGEDIFVFDVILPDTHDTTITDSVVPETDACIPQCGSIEGVDLRECGEDGCGDVCGFCGYGYACDNKEGVCIEICIPDCLTEGKQCGDDGCGGDCGGCGINYICGQDFKCHPDVCQPDCVQMGKECGDDNCGGSCGTCGESEVCSVGGLCAPGACFGVDKDRNTCSLDEQYLYICTEVGDTESLLKIDCYAKTGPECGERGCDCHYNVYSGKNECIEKPPCVPDCEDKECGDDGCGGLCDTCTGGWRCTVEYTCRPMEGAECVWIDWVGTCWEDNWLYQCSSDSMGQGEILAEDCTASGKTCYYNINAHQYICGTID